MERFVLLRVPRDLALERGKWWFDYIEKYSKIRNAQPGWQQDVARMVAEDKGMVLDVFVHRKRKIYEKRKPWNKGDKKAGHWGNSEKMKQYYAKLYDDSCADYRIGVRRLYSSERVGSRAWPPDNLPAYLRLSVLNDVPDEFKPLIQE